MKNIGILNQWLNKEIDECEFDNSNETFDDYMFGTEDAYTYKKIRRTREEIMKSEIKGNMLYWKRKIQECSTWLDNLRGLLGYVLFGLSIFALYFYVN